MVSIRRYLLVILATAASIAAWPVLCIQSESHAEVQTAAQDMTPRGLIVAVGIGSRASGAEIPGQHSADEEPGHEASGSDADASHSASEADSSPASHHGRSTSHDHSDGSICCYFEENAFRPKSSHKVAQFLDLAWASAAVIVPPAPRIQPPEPSQSRLYVDKTVPAELFPLVLPAPRAPPAV